MFHTAYLANGQLQPSQKDFNQSLSLFLFFINVAFVCALSHE